MCGGDIAVVVGDGFVVGLSCRGMIDDGDGLRSLHEFLKYLNLESVVVYGRRMRRVVMNKVHKRQ